MCLILDYVQIVNFSLLKIIKSSHSFSLRKKKFVLTFKCRKDSFRQFYSYRSFSAKYHDSHILRLTEMIRVCLCLYITMWMQSVL